MATDLNIQLVDRPGALADMAGVLGDAGVNIEGIAGITRDGMGEIHVLVEDEASAREALEAAGTPVVHAHEVLVVDIEDRPGALADVSRRLRDAGVNLALVYLATRTRVVFSVSDMDAARTALGA